MKILLPALSAAISLCLTSCGVWGSISSIKPKMPDVKRGDIARFSFSDLMPSRVPVVEVREKDLKEMKLGKDKALAYQKSRSSFFGSWFGKPVDFKEPALPAGELDNPEFGLLPPKSE
jgi:hypothetical protein